MSDAFSAMGSGYGNGLLPQDPAYLPAMQRLALARSIAGEATNASPTTGLGALARGLQGLLGGYEMNQGNQGVRDTMQQQRQNAMDAYNTAMSPLAQAMTGPPPQAPQATPPAAAPTVTPSAPASAPSSPTAGIAPVGTATAAPIPLGPVVQKLEGNPGGGIYNDGGTPAVGPGIHQAALTDVNQANGTNYTMQDLARDPQLGLHTSNLYLALQQQRFPGRPDLALAAYNAGPTATANAGGPGVPGVLPAAAPYVAKGEAMLNGGGAPAPAAGETPAAGAATPQTGLNNPNIMRAFQLHQAALKMVLADPYNQQTHMLAQGLEQTSQMLMGMDTFIPGPNGTQIQARTGEIKYPPVGRVTTDSAGNVISVDAGGAAHVVSPANPAGAGAMAAAKAGGEAAGANHWHPAVQNGVQGQTNDVTGEFKPVAPQANYQVTPSGAAVDTTGTHPPSYPPRPSVLLDKQGNPRVFNEAGQEVPQTGATPPAAGGAAPNANPAFTQEVYSDQAKNDAAEISKDQATTMAGHNVLGTTATIRSMAPQVTTGVGADQRLAASNILSSLGVAPDTVKEWVGTSTAPGQILQKKLFELSTGATRAMGAREPGSVMLMFQKNYPGMTSNNMTIDAMTRLIDMDQAYKENEIGGRQQYFTGQVQNVAQGKPYAGLSGYQQPDPRVYQAAALATGGMPYSVWTQGLTPAQQTQALQLGSKVYGPGASALDASGVRHTFQPPQPPQGVPNGGP